MSTPSVETPALPSETTAAAVWLCEVCGWCYDEQAGDPAAGLAPGTAWRDVPDDWVCPDCGVGKNEFEMVQV